MSRNPTPPSAAQGQNDLNSLKRLSLGWWAQRTSREQNLLLLAAVLAAVSLLWWVGLKPAIDSIKRSEEMLPQLRLDASRLDSIVLQAQHLKRRPAAVMDMNALEEALQADARRNGIILTLRPRSALGESASRPGDGPPQDLQLLEMELAQADASLLMDWLGRLPGIVPVQIRSVSLDRSRHEGRDQPGRVSGHIVVAAAAGRQP